TDHRGYIHQGKLLSTPLTERAVGLAVQIDNHDVLAGVEQLLQVVIAMTSDPQSLSFMRENVAKAIEQSTLHVKGPSDFHLESRGNIVNSLVKQIEASPRLTAQGLVKGSLVQRGKWFGGKTGVL